MTKPPAKQKMKKINEEEKNKCWGKKCNRKKMYAWAQIAGTDIFFLYI